jgi:predicted NAD/FAD-dependent oxidoreductase
LLGGAAGIAAIEGNFLGWISVTTTPFALVTTTSSNFKRLFLNIVAGKHPYFLVHLASNALDVQQDNPMDSAGWLQAHGWTYD